MIIGDILAGYRKQRGLSLRKMAKELGLHYSTLLRLEQGRVCDLPTLIKLLDHQEKHENEEITKGKESNHG